MTQVPVEGERVVGRTHCNNCGVEHEQVHKPGFGQLACAECEKCGQRGCITFARARSTARHE